MKLRIALPAALLALLLIFSVPAGAELSADALIGAWETLDGSMTITFYSDGSYVGSSAQGSWKLKDGALWLDDMATDSELSGDVLSVSSRGYTGSFLFRRVIEPSEGSAAVDESMIITGTWYCFLPAEGKRSDDALVLNADGTCEVSAGEGEITGSWSLRDHRISFGGNAYDLSLTAYGLLILSNSDVTEYYVRDGAEMPDPAALLTEGFAEEVAEASTPGLDTEAAVEAVGDSSPDPVDAPANQRWIAGTWISGTSGRALTLTLREDGTFTLEQGDRRAEGDWSAEDQTLRMGDSAFTVSGDGDTLVLAREDSDNRITFARLIPLADRLVGAWQSGNGAMSLTLREDGTFALEQGDRRAEGDWSVEDQTLRMGDSAFTVSLREGSLILTGQGEEQTLTLFPAE